LLRLLGAGLHRLLSGSLYKVIDIQYANHAINLHTYKKRKMRKISIKAWTDSLLSFCPGSPLTRHKKKKTRWFYSHTNWNSNLPSVNRFGHMTICYYIPQDDVSLFW
jgi:hypothetical protein